MILLKFEGFELGLAPENGGSVTHFLQSGINLLRPAEGKKPTQMAAFPMVPFSGRIGEGRFTWQDREVKLAANFPPEPHTIHGQGWTSAWDVVSKTEDRALLSYTHEANDWPWAYRAEQDFRLSDRGLTLEMTLTNLSNEPMPGGLGWHPYFPAKGAEIEANTAWTWEMGPDKLPFSRRAPEAREQLRGGKSISILNLDTPFETTGGATILRWPEHRKTLRLLTDQILRFLVVYTPSGEDYFCAEPVSHIPDMHNLAAPADQTGLVTLKPGETLSGSIMLDYWPEVASESVNEERRAPVR
jgi:aldose 1-epimerase